MEVKVEPGLSRVEVDQGREGDAEAVGAEEGKSEGGRLSDDGLTETGEGVEGIDGCVVGEDGERGREDGVMREYAVNDGSSVRRWEKQPQPEVDHLRADSAATR